jgi:DNA-binding NarL/FixJ family response regulator
MDIPIRILLVEDEPLWQQGIKVLLETRPRFALVGIADRFDTAIHLFETQQPEIILLDWKIQGEQDGLAVGHALLGLGVRPEHIVLISGSSSASIPAHPFLFVPKSHIVDELLPLLESVTAR